MLGEFFFTALINGGLAFLGAFWVALFLKVVLRKPESFAELFQLSRKKHWILSAILGLSFIILALWLIISLL